MTCCDVWKQPGVAALLDAHWRDSKGERQHRKALAALCRDWLPPGAALLEAGCGTGLVYEQLVPAVVPAARYTGIDVAEPMLAIARAAFPGGRFTHADAARLPFTDGAFGLVACFEVLGHLPDPGPVLAELLRVTSGMVLFTVWPAETGVTEGTETFMGRPAPHRRYSREYVTAMLTAAGAGLAAVTCLDMDDGVHAAYAVRKS